MMAQLAIKRYLLLVPPREIVLLKSIIEGYDDFGVLRTLDPEKGLIEILVAGDFTGDVDRILSELKKELDIRDASLSET